MYIDTEKVRCAQEKQMEEIKNSNYQLVKLVNVGRITGHFYAH